MTGKSSLRRSGAGIARETNLKRRVNVRREREAVLIVTNGTCTERQYFDGLRREPWVDASVRVTVRSGAPEALVAYAKALRDANDYEQVWVVCDVDEFDVTGARMKAAATGVGLALSMPCFEVWLIMHKTASCPGFNHASQAGQYLRKLLPGWQKEQLDFSDFRDGVYAAVERARKRGDPPSVNPSTAVWRVVESIRGGSEET